MKGENEARRAPIVRTTLEAIYAFTHFLAPVMPIAGETIFRCLNTAPVCAPNLRDDMYNLSPGTAITLGDILFQKIEIASAASASAPAVIPVAENKGGKTSKSASGPQTANGDSAMHPTDFSKVDIRVGVITKVWNHETAERLYCEEVDVGEPIVRQIASGLRQYYTIDQLLGRQVLVVCNLKESKFQGFLSQGMVLAAKSASGDKVELVSPPEGSRVGERVFAVPRGTDQATTTDVSQPLAFSVAKLKKDKVWESVAQGLRTDSNGMVIWNCSIPVEKNSSNSDSGVFTVSASLGPCTVPTLTESIVS